MPASRRLRLVAAPHLHGGRAVPRLMLHSVIALLPVTVFAVVVFGLAALATIVVAILACLLAERAFAPPSALGDGSAMLTGLLLGLSLPPALPLWMVALGGFLAIGVGKHLFGGLGAPVFHPVLVGRVFLQAAFPAAMAQAWVAPLTGARATELPATSLALPFMSPAAPYDGLSGATPLTAVKAGDTGAPLADLWLGTVAGSVGETSALLLLLGGIYLVAMRVIDWRIPVALLATVAVLGAALHGLDAERHPAMLTTLGSGGLMLGAWFLASDPSVSPMTRRGAWIYGLAIGALVVVIRQYSGQAEGVMYALLLGSALTPHIDRWTRPQPLPEGAER
ncbi:MAG: RnfABCDGE type electron transport complex subunit D [Gammaproteobacteria bacterium]|nr:RnfABCDGE type electron transport complex subunit D [Gammaproteobacteria bacterium]